LKEVDYNSLDLYDDGWCLI